MLLFLDFSAYSLNSILGQIWLCSISLHSLLCLFFVQSSKWSQTQGLNSEATISAQCPQKPLVPLHSCLQLNEPLFTALLNKVAKSEPSQMPLAFHLRKGVLLISYQTSPEEQKYPPDLHIWVNWEPFKEQIWFCLLIWFSALEVIININTKLKGKTLGSSGRKSAQNSECELARMDGPHVVLIMMKTLPCSSAFWVQTNATEIQPKCSEITSPVMTLHVPKMKSWENGFLSRDVLRSQGDLLLQNC